MRQRAGGTHLVHHTAIAIHLIRHAGQQAQRVFAQFKAPERQHSEQGVAVVAGKPPRIFGHPGTESATDGGDFLNQPIRVVFHPFHRPVHRRIIEGAAHVASQIQEVSSAVQKLSERSAEVVKSIRFIAEIAENNAAGTQNVSAATEEQLASMEEISGSATELARMADELQQLIHHFNIGPVHRQSHHRTATAP